MSSLPTHHELYEPDVAAALLDQINGDGDKAYARLERIYDNAMLNGNETTVPGILAAFLVLCRIVANMHPEDVRIFLTDKIIEGGAEE
jgi:hypothetical protein